MLNFEPILTDLALNRLMRQSMCIIEICVEGSGHIPFWLSPGPNTILNVQLLLLQHPIIVVITAKSPGLTADWLASKEINFK